MRKIIILVLLLNSISGFCQQSSFNKVYAPFGVNPPNNFITATLAACGNRWITAAVGNDTIKEFMSVYYKKMINENKDTIHVSLKEFNNHCKYIIDNFFEGDSIYLHFHDHKRWTDVPLRVSFN